ncbi:MAG: FG-GAP repeat protein, partial [Acidimicrobiales bacterium]
MGRIPRRGVALVVGVVTVGALAAGAVAALTTVGSREISQSTSGASGTAEAGDFFSVAIAVGHFNGDRFADVVVAAPHEDRGSALPDAGIIQVMYGSRSGVRTAGDMVIHKGSGAGDQFGSSVAVGNFNGDRFEDLVVGVAGKDIDGAVDAGEVVVLYGTRDGLSSAGSDRFGQDTEGVEGDPDAGDFFGHSVTSGDFNGDGFHDV